MTDPIDRINTLRQKVINGEELTNEEMREAVQSLREQRKGTTEPLKEPTLPSNLNDLF